MEDIYESESDSDGEDTAPDVPLAPPPTIEIAGETDKLEYNIVEEEMGPHLNMFIPQSKPSRRDSMLMTITGSIPMFETEEQELSLPPHPPSPPASETSEGDGDDLPPTVPTTAPPAIPDESFSHTEDKGRPPPPRSEVPNGLPLLPSEKHGLQNGPPTNNVPLISVPDDSILRSMEPPTPPSSGPPLLPDTPDGDSESSPDGRGCPSGFTQLEIDLTKRAKGGLGVTVVSSGAPTNNLFMIRRIIPAGAAAKDGRLRPGDRLVAVNEKNLAGLNHAAVLQELSCAPKECRLTIWRDQVKLEADTTPPSYPNSRRSGSRSSLMAGSDEDLDKWLLQRSRSLSTNSLENSALAIAKKLSASKGISPRSSLLVHNQNRMNLSVAAAYAPHVNESPLSKRWSAEDAIFSGPAGEGIDFSPPIVKTSPINQSPVAGNSPKGWHTSEPGHIGVNDIMNGDEEYPKETPPTTTPPHPPSTPPPPIPSAPPSTMYRSTKLDQTVVSAAMKVAADEITSSEDEEEVEGPPPPLPQTTPPPNKEASEIHPPISQNTHSATIKEEELSPPLPQTTPPSSSKEEEAPPPPPLTKPPSSSIEEESPPPLPQTTPPPTDAEATRDDKSANKERLLEIERPKSLGPVPKGKRLDDAPFEIEVLKGILGGLGLTVCENELGMIAVKALTNRSPITKDGNIKIGDHIISINDESLLGKRLTEADAIIKSLPRGPVRIVAMAPPRNVTGGGIQVAGKLKPTPSNNDSPSSRPLASSVSSKVPSTSPSRQQTVDEEGIVRVLLHRYGGLPLGFTIEGGTDTPLKYVYIQSLSVGSPASNSGLFMKGDQIVMVGEECLIGKTHQEARKVLETSPTSVEIVAQRKQSPKQVPKASILETHSNTATMFHSGSETDLPNAASANSLSNMDKSVVESGTGDELPSINVVVPEEPSPGIQMVPEERLIVELHRTNNEKLGLSITGGINNPNLPEIHVKKVLEDSVAGRSGQLKRGDRIVAVNGMSLKGATHKSATELLRSTGDHVTFVIARKIGRRISTFVTPFESRLTSKHGSGDHTRQSSKCASPLSPRRLGKPTSSSVESSRGSSRSRTPPVNVRKHNRRVSLGQSGEVLAFKDRSTLPRNLGPKQGVRLVELHKGPTGLGMQIQGGKDRGNTPITVKLVFPGGVAHKSGKINPGDVILEANSISFENLTHAEALKTLKGFPQGQLRLIVRDRTAVAQRRD